jgi:predicted DCC family thiol-disulfide oxidoreductase YuxK
MKNLAHKIIIYDDVCPLCKTYTGSFVQLGWLPEANRLGFSQAPKAILDQIDKDRARHEIPLFDTETGETLYGKDALFFIFGEQFPLLKPLFRFSLFRALVFGLYQIITYNRRIIAGSQKPETGFDCAPDFNTFYRWLYIGLVAMLSAFLLRHFDQDLSHQWIVVAGLLVIGILYGLLIRGLQKKTDFFGHLATVVLICSILFNWIGFNPITMLVIPFLGIYLYTKRLALL